jgi:hypothetical protein
MPRKSRDRPWVVIFILLSLLAHLLFVVAIVVVSRFMPTPKLKDNTQLSSVSLSLEQPPPPVPAIAAPPHRIFMPTSPDAEATHKITPIESDNDTRLRSKNQVARAPDSLMPDITAKREHPANMHDSPNAPSKAPPHPAQTSATAQQQQQQKPSPQQQTATQPQPQPAQAKQPSQTAAKQPTTTPEKTPVPKVAQVALDPNGLPVLPPIAAPTMAPASQRQEATPASSLPEVAQDVHGAVGSHGDDSAAAMATELGKYKAKVYRTVGSLWYHKVDQQFQVLPVGMVHIQFTIHQDGSVDTKVLDGNEGSLQILLSISLNSIRESAPFDPFTPSMIREVGESYTDDFTFSIYGGGQ